jgi:hypothetical protein
VKVPTKFVLATVPEVDEPTEVSTPEAVAPSSVPEHEQGKLDPEYIVVGEHEALAVGVVDSFTVTKLELKGVEVTVTFALSTPIPVTFIPKVIFQVADELNVTLIVRLVSASIWALEASIVTTEPVIEPLE